MKSPRLGSYRHMNRTLATWLYTTAILLGSCLLFLVQPLCAKMLLPLMGGTPAAWNTCMVFFQAGLLLGYAYAHAGPRWLGVGWHGVLHIVLLIGAYFTLPLRLPDEIPAGWHPIAWLLMSLTLAIGLPFTLLAAGAPLVQRWFVARTLAAPRDPYFLYAASNIGSFLALGIFPFLLEPFFSLSVLSQWWTFGFILCVVLLAFCVPTTRIKTAASPSAESTPSPQWRQRGRWIMLACIPSSLLLSVTTHLTTDIAPMPLLWLLPMAIYLATFTLVFASRRLIPQDAIVRWLPIVILGWLIVMLSEATEPMPLVMGVHLLGFFWLAMLCHGELSRTRPAADQLTDFYLCLAIGGVLGGILNALVAPLLFSGLLEYPLMIGLACLFGLENGLRPTRDDGIWVGVLLTLTAALVAFWQWVVHLDPGPVSVAAMFAGPLVIAYTMHRQPARFALGIAAILLASGLYHGVQGTALHRERSYFGIHRVTESNGFRRLVHGNTIHGQQSLDPETRHLPLTYYAEAGPIGSVFHALKGDARLEHVGAVGLGTGSLAYYAEQGYNWTFFEIDPSVIAIAENPKLFTYLRDTRGNVRIELGDARLQLKKSPKRFGLLVVDAFGSDAIPAHLLTREALQVYLDHLEPNGILAFHVSNRYVDLEPVLALLAKDAKCEAFFRKHDSSPEQQARGLLSSEWLVIVRQREDLPAGLHWQAAKTRRGLPVWTDDSSNLFQVLRW
jgi:spermidine synthase